MSHSRIDCTSPKVRYSRTALSRARASAFCIVGLLGSSLIGACSDDDNDKGQSRSLLPGTPGAGTPSTGEIPGNGGTTGSGGTAGSGTATNTPAAGSGTSGANTGTATSGGTGASGANASGGGAAGGNTTGTGVPGSAGAAGSPGHGSTATGAGGVSGAAGSSSSGATSSADAGAALALDDGQILFIVDTLNAGEVNEARAALPRLSDSDIRSFAQAMIDEHGAARDQLLRFSEAQMILPEVSDLASELQDKSETIVTQLLATSANEIDGVYVQSQQDAHTEALSLLDQLLMAADSEALRTQLTELRGSVQAHLNQAQALPGAR